MRYAPRAEPVSTTSNAATSAIFTHPGCLLSTGGTGVVGEGTGCLGACGGCEGPGRVAGIGVFAVMASGGCDIRTGGPFISACAGTCITGADPVGVTGNAGVADEMPGDGGIDGAFEGDCRGCWMGYVGLFIVSREPLIPLNDGGLTGPGNGGD